MIATQHKHRARPPPSRSLAAIPSATWRGTGTRRAQARRAAKESMLWRAPWITSDMATSFIELSTTFTVECMCIGYKNILVNLDDAPKVERTYRSGDLHHERAQRATYSSETLENGSGYSR